MSAAAAGVMMTLFHWEKLSPAEFYQLQEYVLCEYILSASAFNYNHCCCCCCCCRFSGFVQPAFFLEILHVRPGPPEVEVKVKVMTICIAPIHGRSGIARIVKGYHSFTCTPCVSSTSGMSYTCLCLPSRSWYSFTDSGRIEGRVDHGAK